MNNIIVMHKHQNSQPAPCAACMKKIRCPAYAMEDVADGAITMKTVRPGDFITEAGDDFDCLYMVRSGFFKSSIMDAAGEMQVTGFYLPGEIFGADGIHAGSYSDTVVALDTGCLCRIPLSLFSQGEQELANGHLSPLTRLLGAEIARSRSMLFNLGKMDAKRRFATFLMDISGRMQASGYNPEIFKLCMSRTDISNYLCLAIETISRLFSQFQAAGIIRVDRRELTILDRRAVEMLVENGLEDAA